MVVLAASLFEDGNRSASCSVTRCPVAHRSRGAFSPAQRSKMALERCGWPLRSPRRAASLPSNGDKSHGRRKRHGAGACAPPISLGTVAHEREGVVSIEHGELGAAQELERRLR